MGFDSGKFEAVDEAFSAHAAEVTLCTCNGGKDCDCT
jgi:hypothetical protein